MVSKKSQQKPIKIPASDKPTMEKAANNLEKEITETTHPMSEIEQKAPLPSNLQAVFSQKVVEQPPNSTEENARDSYVVLESQDGHFFVITYEEACQAKTLRSLLNAPAGNSQLLGNKYHI